MSNASQQHPAASPIQTVAMVSLGCPKNLVDSEKMLGLIAEAGYVPTGDESIADALIVNTCGFLEAAKTESLEVLQEAGQRREAGQLQRLIAAGCLVQRHRAKLLEWCPQIDAMVGVFDRDRIADALEIAPNRAGDLADDRPRYSSLAANATVARQDRQLDPEQTPGYFESDGARLRVTPRHYAYLRISEGCNQKCTFCTIPSIRGKMRSKPIDAIAAEAEELLRDGAFELNLIGQDTTSYGDDIGYAPGLVGLLERLNEVAASHGGAWIRLMYAYPSRFTEAMMDAIADLPHVLPYIDMPLQHINDEILDSMRRNTSRDQIETVIEQLRQRMPDIAIRTTFITGYPGETDQQHQELLQFIRNAQFEQVGVFHYSPEPGTPAGTLHQSQAVDEQIMELRYGELMLAQQEAVFERNLTRAEGGQQIDVLIEGEAELEGDDGGEGDAFAYIGRSTAQAPDVDNVTYVVSAQPLSPGEVVECRITGSDDYDLIAQPVADLESGTGLPILNSP